MGAMALHGYSSMELKSRSFTSKEPHVAREPQVADPWFSRNNFIAGEYLKKHELSFPKEYFRHRLRSEYAISPCLPF
jgi:hypothetical protein